MKAITTLIVISDDRQARLLENRGVGKGINEVKEISASDFDDVETRYSDRPGRGHASAGTARAAMERSTSEQRQERQAFARHVLDNIETLMQKGEYDRLAMVAAPQMLGELRNIIGADLRKKLVFDIDKDLVNIPTAKLADHFADKIAF